MIVRCVLKKNIIPAAVMFISAAFSVYADISFENPDINPDNKIVFSVNHDISGAQSYRTAFYADAATASDVRILTCYPEKMELLSSGSVLQFRNRYGTARYSVADANLSWITRADSIPSNADRIIPQSVSPDGKWICYVKKSSPASGSLILKNSSTFQETVLDTAADFSYDSVPVIWSPDGSILLYEKSGSVYFCEPKAAFQKVQLTESYRKIGDGKISSVCWANEKTLVFIDRDIVYKISANELYTRGLYAPVVGSGTPSGRLPSEFDERYDRFWVNKACDSMVLIQKNNFALSFRLAKNGFERLEPSAAKYLSDNRGSVIDAELLWADDGSSVLWIDILGMTDGKRRSCIYRESDGFSLVSIIENSGAPAVSPDGKSVAFGAGESLYVYDISQWKQIGRLTGEKVVSYVWSGNNTVYAGGVSSVREWRIKVPGSDAGSARTLFLSSVGTVFWRTPSLISASDSSRSDIFYDYNPVKNVWQKSAASDEDTVPAAKVQNGKYRVFTGATQNKKFADTLYIRTLSGKSVTRPLFPDTAVKSDGRKKVALAIDAVDDITGLGQILSVLKEFDIPATFFINGEFIRRYPLETNQIVSSGFDCASMFFSTADLTSKDFVVDEDFVRRGLARNEDEFFSATGKELSLIWHAPSYKSDSSIRKAGSNSGYKYAEAGRFSLDTITLEDAAEGIPGYLSASQIISFYEENTADGSIIPVTAGISDGKRSDYLYEKLDLLIGTLLDRGFEFVLVRDILH